METLELETTSKDFIQFLNDNKPLMAKIHEEIKDFLNCNTALIAKFGYDQTLSYACDQVIQKHITVIKGDN